MREVKMSSSAVPEPVEASAPSLEEAIEKGLTALGLTRNDVIIEIVEEGSTGVLGLGARDAVVRLTPLRGPQRSAAPRAVDRAPAGEAPAPTEEELEQEAETARETLNELLGHMHVRAKIEVSQAEPGFEDEEGQVPWVLNIQGADLGVLIGRKGETLEALQYVLRQLVSHQLQRRSTVIVDVEGYKSRRESTLRSLARRMAEQIGRAHV